MFMSVYCNYLSSRTVIGARDAMIVPSGGKIIVFDVNDFL